MRRTMSDRGVTVQGRNRGVAAAQRRMREEREQEELDHDSERKEGHDNDE
jgi:hypothetical protein